MPVAIKTTSFAMPGSNSDQSTRKSSQTQAIGTQNNGGHAPQNSGQDFDHYHRGSPSPTGHKRCTQPLIG
jgi:hypothetical protein